MKLIIVSGLSGSGKSVALHTLEDLGYYCIDNLPAGLLSALALELKQAAKPVKRVAIGIDARNLPQSLQQFSEIIDKLKTQDISSEILFITCDPATLIKRFSETRRRHPLSNEHISLAEAVELERQLLEPIAQRADLFIDTSQTTIHQLRDMIHQRVERREDSHLSLMFQSFGFKHGIPSDADFVFDARCLPNPHWHPELRPLTGRDEAVAHYLGSEAQVTSMVENLTTFLDTWIPAFEADNRSYLTIAIGCTGGQHRSVYLVEQLQKYFKGRYPNVTTRHRELP
ncbi:RNase adapter protein RapZ [hydrothermal vent metagenome]|uniref:RNase adapter protein RapZ n=1 Tax=hydrothermal vent metagenome TaxID=652676 RepID=A0A3B0Z776_9ZZZZ